MLNKRGSSFSIVLGCVFIGYAFLMAIVMGSFSGLFVLGHFAFGIIAVIYWLVKGGLKESQLGETKTNATKKCGALFHTGFDVLAALTIVVCVNLLAYRYDKRIDTTASGVYSLATETRDVLAHVDCPVHITAVIDPNRRSEYEAAYALLSLYSYYKKKYITFEILDPRKHPHRIEKELGLKNGEILAIEYNHRTNSKIGRGTRISEEAITNALARMVNGKDKVIYYVVGHGEPDLASGALDGVKKAFEELKENGFLVKTIVLAEHLEIPDDAVGVMLVSPQKDLLAAEEQIIQQYVNNGGGVLMLSDPDTSNSISTIAEKFGIEVGKNVVLDQMQGLQGAPEIGWQVVIREYLKHSITEHFVNGDYSVFLLSSTVSLMPKDKRDPQGDYSPFVLTKSNSAWAETNLDLLFSEEPKAMVDENQDLIPPLYLAVAYEKKVLSGRGGRLVVFGDSNWIMNPNLNMLANKKLFLSTVNWISHEVNALTIAPREMRNNNQVLAQKSFERLALVGLLMPELLLILGLAICWRRKRR